MQGEDQVKQIFTFYEEPPEYYPGSDYQTYIPVDWNEVEDGESYCVVLCIYDEYDSENEVIQTKGACFVADLADYYAPCVPGFYTVPLAGIAKTTIEDEEGEETGYALAVTEQYIIGDITITDFYRLFPFAMNFLISFTEGAVADDETFNVYAVYLKDGKIYDDGGAYLIRDNADFAPNDDGTFYAYFEDGSIKWTDDISELAFSSNCFILAAFELQGA